MNFHFSYCTFQLLNFYLVPFCNLCFFIGIRYLVIHYSYTFLSFFYIISFSSLSYTKEMDDTSALFSYPVSEFPWG